MFHIYCFLLLRHLETSCKGKFYNLILIHEEYIIRNYLIFIGICVYQTFQCLISKVGIVINVHLEEGKVVLYRFDSKQHNSYSCTSCLAKTSFLCVLNN